MGMSAGGGSPLWFMCPNERRERNTAYSFRTREFMWDVDRHTVRLTGRTKPYRPPKGSALGVRSTTTTREYECETCGRVGWSNHIDLERRAQ